MKPDPKHFDARMAKLIRKGCNKVLVADVISQDEVDAIQAVIRFTANPPLLDIQEELYAAARVLRILLSTVFTFKEREIFRAEYRTVKSARVAAADAAYSE